MRRKMTSIAAVVVAGILIAIAWYLFARPGQDSRTLELTRLQTQVARLEQEVQRVSPQPSNMPVRPVAPEPAPLPRTPVVAEPPDLVVSSILYSQQRRLAIINGRIVSVGEHLCGPESDVCIVHAAGEAEKKTAQQQEKKHGGHHDYKTLPDGGGATRRQSILGGSGAASLLRTVASAGIRQCHQCSRVNLRCRISRRNAQNVCALR